MTCVALVTLKSAVVNLSYNCSLLPVLYKAVLLKLLGTLSQLRKYALIFPSRVFSLWTLELHIPNVATAVSAISHAGSTMFSDLLEAHSCLLVSFIFEFVEPLLSY